MSELKTTPGPWLTSARMTVGGQWRVSLEADVETIAWCEQPNAFANAHLIAAAPELYEALEAAHKELDHDVPGGCWATGPLTGDYIEDLVACPGCRVLRKIEAALAKARGEAS